MINTSIDVVDALAGLQNILDDGRNLPMDEIAELLLASVQRNFDEEGRPDRWDPRVEPTGSWPLLNKTGNLIASLGTDINGDIVSVTNSASYAGYLNEGTEKMVARPFLMIQESDLDAIEELLAQHFS